MRTIARWIFNQACLGLILGGATASAQLPSADPALQRPAVLDVPYLSQSELLCGGAALAMVERWWGRRGVYAEDFAGLVRPELRGIRTTDLAAAARTRGWETRAFDGTPEEVRRILAEGVPVVALLRVAPDRYHYVVLLAWSDRGVVFHDPARAPSLVITEASFLRQWAGGERWAMELRPLTVAVQAPPPEPEIPASAPPVRSTGAMLPCSPWMAQALDAVADDRLDDAAALLSEAESACPDEPLVRRELAGVRFKQRRLAEAIRLSSQFLAQVPDDSLAWQLLAASRYLAGDREGALRAWNEVGRPVVDLVRVDGLRAVRFGILADAIGVPHGTVLTSNRLALARRRVGDLPALRRAGVEYQPVEGGRVEVRATVIERSVVGRAWRLLASGVIRAAAQREVGLAIASPTGNGELWTGAWRWEHAHPRVAGRVDLPLRLGLTGVFGVEGSWERFRFALDTAPGGGFEETRRSGGATFGGWILPSFRPFAELRLDRWSEGRRYLATTAGAEFRGAGDRLVLTTSVEHGNALENHPSYTRGEVRAFWASAVGLSRRAWSARLGMDIASTEAPLGLWPVASGDLPSAVPLRGHPRTSDGRLPGSTTGRRMIHGGLSGDQPVYHLGVFTLAVGIFLDGASIRHPADGSARQRLHLDAGGGIRIGILDGQLGVLRVDLGTGLTDRRTALSVGVHQSWPPYREREH